MTFEYFIMALLFGVVLLLWFLLRSHERAIAKALDEIDSLNDVVLAVKLEKAQQTAKLDRNHDRNE